MPHTKSKQKLINEMRRKKREAGLKKGKRPQKFIDMFSDISDESDSPPMKQELPPFRRTFQSSICSEIPPDKVIFKKRAKSKIEQYDPPIFCQYPLPRMHFKASTSFYLQAETSVKIQKED